MDQLQLQKQRNNAALAGAILAALIGIVGVSMGFSRFLQSFSDWPKIAQWPLALFAALAIEGGLLFFTYTIIKAAATAAERGWAAFGAATCILITAINIATHNASVRSAGLARWQILYTDHVGPAVIILVLVLVLVQLALRPETAEIYRERQRSHRVKENVQNLEEELIESDEFKDWFKRHHRERVFERAARRAGWEPPATRSRASATPPATPVASFSSSDFDTDDPRGRYVNGEARRPGE